MNRSHRWNYELGNHFTFFINTTTIISTLPRLGGWRFSLRFEMTALAQP